MIQPLSCTVEYVLEGDPEEEVRTECFGIAEATSAHHGADLSLKTSFSGELFAAVVVASKPLRVLGCEVEFQREFARGEKVLLNGYQSWTDTVELSPWAVMRGMGRTPKGVVDRFVLDGSGDYRYVDYPARPGALHGWTYGYIRSEDRGELVASLDESAGFTLLRMDASASRVSAGREPLQRALAAGETWTALELAYLPVDDGSDAALDGAFARWFELAGIVRRPAQPLVGYCSWYRHYNNIDEAHIMGDLQSAKNALARLDARGFVPVFQIDDGYAVVGDWLDYDRGCFPSGMKALAGWIEEAGFVPGLWMAPFVCEEDSQLFLWHMDWILRDSQGHFARTGGHWSGGLALDILNPQVQDYVRECIHTATQEWGFKLLKLDFLYAACMVPHGGLNRGQLMALAVDLVREAAGDDVIINGCGVPLGSAFGKFEFCRIGCDVGLDWDGNLAMRFAERERVSTKNSLMNTVYRAPLNGKAFLNDPDVLLLRDDVRLSEEQRQLLADADGCFGGMLLTSDDMGMWNEEQLSVFQGCLDTMRARGL